MSCLKHATVSLIYYSNFTSTASFAVTLFSYHTWGLGKMSGSLYSNMTLLESIHLILVFLWGVCAHLICDSMVQENIVALPHENFQGFISESRKHYIKHKIPCLTAIPNTEKRVENTTAEQSIFDQLWGVCKGGQTWSWVFDISSQSKLKIRRIPRNEIIKSMQIKIRYPITTVMISFV